MLGVLSLIIWALTIIVTVKYIVFVLRADNSGEGGTLSLMALARGSLPQAARLAFSSIGICGASLFFGDAVITPAISVLSAVEGMKVVTPALRALCRAADAGDPGDRCSPCSGSARAASATVFGPITVAVVPGDRRFRARSTSPTTRACLLAVNPLLHRRLPGQSPEVAFVTIGAVFLAVTGAEALYADLGHFGRKPIVLAWLWIVFPCLLLNYFGQGAFVLAHGGTVGHPFFEMSRAGRCCRWWCWRPPRPSSPARR